MDEEGPVGGVGDDAEEPLNLIVLDSAAIDGDVEIFHAELAHQGRLAFGVVFAGPADVEHGLYALLFQFTEVFRGGLPGGAEFGVDPEEVSQPDNGLAVIRRSNNSQHQQQ